MSTPNTEQTVQPNEQGNFPITCSHCRETGWIPAAMIKHKHPREGQWSLCPGCGEVSLFGADLRLRRMTDEEEHKLMRSGLWVTIERARQLIIQCQNKFN